MFKILLLVTVAAATSKQYKPAEDQLVDFKKKTSGPIGLLRTGAGALVDYKDATCTLNTNLLRNEYLLDTITHITRERIPERFTHAKGAGGFGYFETTHDISHICKAKMFNKVGKKTPIAVRFSPAVTEKGGVETSPDVRGFAIKFYTEDGNFDILGLSTEIFAIADPVYFSSLFHSQKRNPATNLLDKNAFWDFLTLRPESFFILLVLLSDRGIPDGYRHMPGFAIHTYEVYNEKGDKSYVKFHMIPNAGIKNLNSTEAAMIAGKDPDYATRDVYTSIANGEKPSWTFSLQIMSEEEKNNASFDIFDITRKWSQQLYPLQPVGKLYLNRNPINYFAEIEQLAYSPANLISGILGSPDKLFELRCLAYRDAQNQRLGVNYQNIPVNCPITKVLNYNRDGVPSVGENGRDESNYFPNSFNGPVPSVEKNRPELSQICQSNPDNFNQASDFYSKEMTPEEQGRLIQNIAGALCPAASFLQERAIKIFTSINSDLGKKVSSGLASLKGQCPKP